MQTIHTPVTCRRCNYSWVYKGNRKRICCAKCKTSITLFKQQPDRSYTTTMHLPLNVINSIAFQRAIGWAKTNGQDYIELQSIIGGVLSLA